MYVTSTHIIAYILGVTSVRTLQQLVGHIHRMQFRPIETGQCTKINYSYIRNNWQKNFRTADKIQMNKEDTQLAEEE
jgi:hypothetical protein